MQSIVTHEDYGTPVPNHAILHAFLAEKAGYEAGFTYRENDLGGYDLNDAECATVPSMSDLVLRNPWLIGQALKWLADNQCEK